jgi:D-threo-aldose 1-dehydrogenase
MDPTRRVKLGNTTVSVTQLGVGTNPLGGLYEPIPHEDAVAVIERCWDHGIRFFDTAPVYGYGNAERAAGGALQGHPRDSFTLTTKVGRLLLEEGPDDREDTMVLWEGEQLYRGTDDVKPYFDFSYDGVMRSLEASIERTGIDRFDALHIHDPDWFPEEALDGAFKALKDLKDEGTINAIGCGMNQWEVLARFAREGDFDCFLLAGRYTLLDQSALAELLPLCEKKGIAIVNGGVYNSGILCVPEPEKVSADEVSRDPADIPTWTNNMTYNYVPADQAIIDRVTQLKAVCDRYNVPLMAAAIQFPLHHPAIPTIVMGPRTIEHVDSNVAMFKHDIPDDLWAEMKHEGLLPEEAPTPG